MSAHDELAAIDARAQAATEGSWRLWKDSDSRRGAAVETAWSYDADGADTELVTDWCLPADAEFIAAARTDVPRLVAALRAVEDTLGLYASGDLYDLVMGRVERRLTGGDPS